MPRYEYKCDKCGNLFEVTQKFADEPVTLHENCGGPVHRLLSVPALQFKGSGFYVNDYAKGSGAAPNDSPKKDSSESTATSNSDSSSKSSSPTAKSESGSKSESSGKSESGSKSESSSKTESKPS